MKILIQNRQKTSKISPQKIRRDSSALLRLLGLKDAELSILFVNNSIMKGLNHKYRGIDRTTDVLSFPQIRNKIQDARFRIHDKKNRASCIVHRASPAPLVLGDVVINLQAVKSQAPEHGLSFNEELRWLLIHGILHLIGYDHERSKYAERKMRTKEKELLGYLERSKD